ncbi:AmmeMemoRadiSam system radical SAM enzyme [Candidatus Woesearchaeota archaeon]|nr:AmmeMemoRadiSam system radical SAM enzyme [Candidatus Woesearchaeota archaeon]RLE42449.1 MAG: AmmeMemoRadiSam system radical SAM enzyme [Candidatus Woesearchaeota archaeon]
MGKKKRGTFLDKKITRREFLKYALTGVIGFGVGAYFLRRVFTSPLALNNTNLTTPSSALSWNVKEAYHYSQLAGGLVECQVCPNHCRLTEKQRSICRVKENISGKLYTFVYGNPCAVHIDPIEKKPLYHFLPGSGAFSIATAGCNFRCLNCQNWEISQFPPEKTNNIKLMPKEVVEYAIAKKCNSIAYTYSEPTAFYEYMYDTAKLAHEKGIKNLWITNGYMSEGALSDFCQYLDAANVDLKSFKEEIYNKLNSGHLQPVLDTLKLLPKKGVWLEITNLIVPTYTDDLDMIREMCKWIRDELGTDVPLHFSRFSPHYKLKHLPATPYSTLKKAREIALEAGLKYVYIGNVAELEGQQTYCPKCKKVVVRRNGFSVLEINLTNGRCKYCGERIAGVWSL